MAIAAALIGAFLAGAGVYLYQQAQMQALRGQVKEAESEAQTARAQFTGLKEQVDELTRQVGEAERKAKKEKKDVERSDREAKNARQADSGTGDLADGEWYGTIDDPTASPDQIKLDVMQFFSGDAANKAAEQDGKESPVSDDVYVRNASTDLRTLPVSRDVEVKILKGNSSAQEAVTYKQFVGLFTTATKDEKHLLRNGYWVTTEGGEVVKIEEQYHP